MVSIWVPRMCRNGILKSQILVLFRSCLTRSRNWYPKFKKSEILGGIGCDEAGNDADLGIQDVPKWGFEIADPSSVRRLCGKAAALAKEF